MDFMERAKQTISMAGREFSQVANDFSNAAKQNMKIREAEKQLRDGYYQAGRQIMEKFPEEFKKMLPDLSIYIEQKMEEIEELKKEFTQSKEAADQEEEIRGKIENAEEILMKTCPVCGNKIKAEDQSCVYCGTKF